MLHGSVGYDVIPPGSAELAELLLLGGGPGVELEEGGDEILSETLPWMLFNKGSALQTD